MTKHNEASRRLFLKQAVAFSSIMVFPTIITKAISGVDKPLTGLAGASERVNLACCGIGNQGGVDIKSLYDTGLCNIVALCDTDMGAPHTQKTLKQFPDVPRFQDFRVMFDKMGNQIEAITAGVPDHSHFPITMMALALGKHVYVEKPMARTFNEVELMMKAARKYNVATQMGNQGHSEANYFQFKAWTEAGIVKDITQITEFMNNGWRWHGMKVSDHFPEQPIPALKT